MTRRERKVKAMAAKSKQSKQPSIVNGNLTCAECGSITFKIDTTHSVEDGEVGRITLTEIECAECATSQMEIDGTPDVPESERAYFKSTTSEQRED